jgi:WD40 repeat protein
MTPGGELLKKEQCILALDILGIKLIQGRLEKGEADDMDFMRNPLLTSYVYPNCVTFDDAGRMFVGDSIGFIRCWDVSITQGQVRIGNEFIIKHQELEDDAITGIIVDPNQANKLIVHSKDNCVRVLEYEMERRKEPRIRLRFFGAKNKSIMV